MNIQDNQPIDLPHYLASDSVIIDVRTPMEHQEKRLACPHIHIPLDQLDAIHLAYDEVLKDKRIYLLCRSGKRAQQAAEKLRAVGCKNIHVVAGGIEACAEKNHPLEGLAFNRKTDGLIKRPISLERQVRITAGLFIMSGVLLAYLFNTAFVLLPFLVGCGLVFAGLTDRCGLALVLTKAPWNNKSSHTQCCTGGRT